MSVENKIKEMDLLSMWRQLKGYRENLLNTRDAIDKLIKDIKKTEFNTIADQDKKDLMSDIETKVNAIK